jgi:hypothetical protein
VDKTDLEIQKMSNPEEKIDRIHQMIKMTWDQGAAAERERIIKLLESHSHETEQESRNCDLCERYYGVGLALALIEGEQK